MTWIQRRQPSFISAVLFMAVLSSAVFAQDAPTTTPADAKAEVEFTEEDLTAVLQEMTPEQMEQLVQAAAQRCLEVERRQVAEEIRDNLLYDESAVKDALEILSEAGDAPPSRQRNIEQICRALATVDERFAEAYKLYQEKNYPKAAELLKANLNPEDTSYLSAAMYYIYGGCCIQQGKTWPGTDAYSDLLVNLPDRISFATAAALQAAKAYEDMGRNLYAMQMYAYCLSNYALAMDKDELSAISERFDKLQDVYRDPMASLTGMVAHVRDRLTKKDVGEGTQKRQQAVVALLEDLIQTAEEKQRPGKNDKPPPGQSSNEEQQQEQSQQQQEGVAGQPAGTPRNPTVGAKESVLVPGPVSRPNRLSKIHDGSDTGTWAELPARQKEAIRNLMRQKLTERRSQMVQDYHRKMAEGE